MVRFTSRKGHPLSMRLSDADIAIIDRAASLLGRSRTELMRDAAVRAAEEVIMENTVIRMSPEGFTAFVELLDRPAKPVPEMVELLKRPAPWETMSSSESLRSLLAIFTFPESRRSIEGSFNFITHD